MSAPTRVHAALGALLVGATLCASSTLGFAQDGPVEGPLDDAALPVTLDARLGYGEKVWGQGFTPVFVDVTALDADQTVWLRFRGSNEGRSLLLELGPVTVTQGQSRRVRGLAASRTWLGYGSVSVDAVTETGAVVGRAQMLSDTSSRKPLLVIDRHGAAPTDFSKLETGRARGTGSRKAQWGTSVVAKRDDLPLSPLGYTGLMAVLLGDLEAERWSEEQAEALAGWVVEGGNLIVSIGKRGALLRQSVLGRKLGDGLDPIPFEQHPLPGKEVSLAAVLGTLGAGADVLRTRPPYSSPLVPGLSDDVLFRDDAGRPFVVRRKHGLGTVTLISADLWSPPFPHGEHTRRLMERLLEGLQDSYQPPARTRYLFHELASVRQPAQVGPAFAVLIVFALVAGPGVYFVLRAKKRGILLWLVIPALTVSFTALVPFYRLVLKDAESTLVGVRWAQSHSGSPVSAETIDTLLFSGGLEQKTLTLPGMSTTAYSVLPPTRMRRRGSARVGPVLGEVGPGALAFDLPVALWGTRYVSFQRTATLKPTTGRVSLRMPSPGDVGLPTIRIDYGEAFPLRDAVILFPSKVGALLYEPAAPLKRGQPFEVRVTSVDPAANYESPEKSLGGLMISRLVAAPFKEQVESGQRAFLIGRTDEPLPVAAQPNVRTRASTTIRVVELDLDYADGVPFGLAEATVEAGTIAEVNTTTVTRELRSRLSFPAAAAEATKLTVRLQAPRGSILRSANLRLSGLKRVAGELRRTPIAFDSALGSRDPSGRVLTLELPEPSTWVGPDGRLELIQVFDRPRSERDTGYSATIEAEVRWGPLPRAAPEKSPPGDGQDP